MLLPGVPAMISIPYGAIKSLAILCSFFISVQISIPYGAIKSLPQTRNTPT